MSEVNTEAVRQVAIQIVKLGVGLTPREFLGALAIAAGQFIITQWPKGARAVIAEGHYLQILRAIK